MGAVEVGESQLKSGTESSSRGDSALTDGILVETSDGDWRAGTVGPPGPGTNEGLASSFEPETRRSLDLTNDSDVSDVEDNADPGRA